MKHLNRYIAAGILTLIITIIFVYPSCVKVNLGGQNASNLISDVALSTGIDAQFRPFNTSNTFYVDSEMIYLTMKLNNAPSNTNIRVKVTYTGGEAASAVNSTIFEKSQAGQGSTGMAFSIKPPAGGFYVGQYSIAVYANDKEQVATQFTVQNTQTGKGWPEVKQFSARPDTIAQGQSTTLTWEVTNATRVTLQPEVGTVPSSGTRSISPSATVTYKLIAANDTASTTRELTVTVGQAVSGSPDLVITDAWLQGSMIYYKVKNIGSVESKATTCYLYVDNMFPAMGGSSFCDVLKPGQERTQAFSSYQWPFDLPAAQAPTPQFGCGPATCHHVPYADPKTLNLNHNIKVCADAKAEINETNENNNCFRKNMGIMMKVDLLQVAHLARWVTSEGEVPQFGAETSTAGAYIPLSGGGLETVPPQVPHGWIQGVFGFFYVDSETKAPKSAPVVVPAKGKFISRIGLAAHAKSSDGVTFKIGMRDMSDNLNFLQEKKMTVPGKFETWEIDLSDYEDQKAYFIMRVEAGASAVDDFAVWQEARLEQME